MYIPFRKVYRAFGELNHLSDEECERALRRARLRPTRLVHAPWVAAVVCALAAAGIVAWFVESSRGLSSMTIDDVIANAGVFVGVPAAVVLAGLIGGLLARDIVLLHLMRAEIHKARCPKCRQSLMGLPVMSRTLGPPEPGEARVRCTECGREWVLVDIGLTPRDLVPWEMRGVPADYGRVKREGGFDTR